MPYTILVPYALQLLCIIHIVRARRSRSWIILLLLLPVGGGLAYLAVELLPDLFKRPAPYAPTPVDAIAQAVAPTARLHKAEHDVSFSPTHENRRILADEYLALGEHARALDMYEKLAVGPFSADPELILARARCLLALERYAEGHALMAALDAQGYWYRRESDVILKLRLLERVEPDPGKVAPVYAEYDKRFQSFEVGYHYVDYLVRNRRFTEARAVVDRYAALKKQMAAMKMTVDQEWAGKLLGIQVPREETRRD
jgi:hypothetical protein